ncbi:fimbrial protein [unidentified bacterial endosymbiont]|uniref:fimbrial protein n=1 Tax=unidentified bacterial endosymbiont TaxID=2355 RepID=UPI0020A090BC|nr:fimbrial protein [unidentified bacterial endosymbiont]
MKEKTSKTFLLFSLFFIFTLFNKSFAYNDCYIESSQTGTRTINYGSINVTSSLYPSDSVNDAIVLANKDIQIDVGSDGIGCKKGGAGNNNVEFFNAADGTNISAPWGNIGMIQTSIPGIVLSATLMCKSSDCASAAEGAGAGNMVNLNLPAASGQENIIHSQGGYPWEGADKGWYLHMTLYQYGSFSPKSGVTSGHTLAGNFARWRIGGSTQGSITFKTSTSSLTFTIPQTTCQDFYMANGEGNRISNNQYALGDYSIANIETNNTKEVPFKIILSKCYASKFTTKLYSSNRAGNNALIGKSAGSASGIGVKIMDTANNLLLKADGSNETTLTPQNWYNDTLAIPFTAQVVADNSTISSGDFSANATFTVTYE